jgi:hypothetical protein
MSIARTLIPLMLALAACSPPAGNSAGAPAADGATATSSPLASNCDAPAVPLAIGASVSGNITAATAYPANARYYCINVGQGVSSVTIDLTGMDVDLDLYVGSSNIQSVQGVDISAGENYEWKSNAFGTGDEHVVINAPQPGVYYAEIVSFEGQPSNYTLTTR